MDSNMDTMEVSRAMGDIWASHLAYASWRCAMSVSLYLLEKGVFDTVPPQGRAILAEISERTRIDPVLLARLMRSPVSVGMFDELEENVWSHNSRSRALMMGRKSGCTDMMRVFSEEMLPPIDDLGNYIEIHRATDLLQGYNCTPFVWYHGKSNNLRGKDMWGILRSTTSRSERFDRGLSWYNQNHLITAFPEFEQIVQTTPTDRTLMVDVGGGRGSALREIRQAFPDSRHDLILQDQKCVLDSIRASDLMGVTQMPHNFFEEQPVKGARVYYLRRVLHDWRDAEAVKILQALVPAMAPDSRVLVSEALISEVAAGRHPEAVFLDIMMLTIGGKERTEKEWIALGNMSGLKLVSIWPTEADSGPMRVVEYMLAKINGSGNILA